MARGAGRSGQEVTILPGAARWSRKLTTTPGFQLVRCPMAALHCQHCPKAFCSKPSRNFSTTARALRPQLHVVRVLMAHEIVQL